MRKLVPYVIAFDLDDDRLFLAELASGHPERRTTLAEQLKEFGGYEGAVSSPSGASQPIDLSPLNDADPERTAVAIVFRDETTTASDVAAPGLLDSGVLDRLEPDARADIARLVAKVSTGGAEGRLAAATLGARLREHFGAGIEDPINWDKARQIAHGVSLIDCRQASPRRPE
jgi:hypothetical protein